MALVVHPYIMGAPHRLKYFRNALAHIRAAPGRAVLDRRRNPRLVCVGESAEAERESVRRLESLGGSEPELAPTLRRRTERG